MRVQTFLPKQTSVKFKKKMKETNLDTYNLAQTLITDSLNRTQKTPLSDYSTRELLEEIWNRIP